MKTVTLNTSPSKDASIDGLCFGSEKLKQKSIREAREHCDMGFKRQTGYINSLNDIIKSIPKQNKAFTDILSRISEGLTDASRHINEGLNKT